MPIITLTSDWGTTDQYLAAVKGEILSLMPEATIVDISHNIKPFNLRQTSYIIRNTYKHFPKGTIHLVSVNSGETGKYRYTVVKYDGHYFIGTDNGLFSLVFDQPPEQIIELGGDDKEVVKTFAALHVFVPAAIDLASGKKPESLGEPKSELAQQLHFKPVATEDSIRGIVIYVDNYENVITNITKETFDQARNGRKFTIECRSEQVHQILQGYQDVPVGEVVALFNQAGHLEIAINQGNASSLLGLYIDAPVSIQFE
jgi:S-adenosylmethionine hydrolase